MVRPVLEWTLTFKKKPLWVPSSLLTPTHLHSHVVIWTDLWATLWKVHRLVPNLTCHYKYWMKLRTPVCLFIHLFLDNRLVLHRTKWLKKNKYCKFLESFEQVSVSVRCWPWLSDEQPLLHVMRSSIIQPLINSHVHEKQVSNLLGKICFLIS